MVLAILVEIIPVNDQGVDMPRLAIIRRSHASVSCAMRGNGVLEAIVRFAQRNGYVRPRIFAQRAAGVLVAFVARVDVCGRDGFVCLVSKRRSPDWVSKYVPSACLETSFPLIETCWMILLAASSTVTENSTSECCGTGT